MHRSRRKSALLVSGSILTHCGSADPACLSILSLPPPQVLQLKISIHPLSDDGNLLDCAVMATMAGLRGSRRWEWEVTGGEVEMVRFLLLFPTPSSPPPREKQHRKKLTSTVALPNPASSRLRNVLRSPSRSTMCRCASPTPTLKGALLSLPFL